MDTITINLDSVQLTEEQFFQLCANNRDFRFERNAKGELIIMPPTGGETGNRNARITQQLLNWTDQDGTGIAFDSSTGFKLPNGANRSPDSAWLPLSRWETLTPQQRQKFIPLCPDFVIELRSPTDQLIDVQNKMQEYLENGTELGWLINPQDKKVEIYRQNQVVEVLDQPSFLSGENVLPNFNLDLRLIW
ncbi:MAG: Uma2 family endonuclease [Halothece sp. Uz-M2-17]|nr:Uma2 family endonuclease [Halothece sp. Uz-M2-17]